MATLVDTLTASGGTESAGFLNDIIAQLWPNINAAGSKMVKDIVEPMFASMLPGPLATLHFVKIDLGKVPLRISKVDTHRTETQGIKLDMDVDWDGRCDIELDGKMIPKIGVEHVKLKGRLSILLCPLTNVIPLIGAAQIAFINPPTLELDFTDAASLADSALIGKTIRKVILDILGSMFVLPNRFLVKLDASNDYFKTYQHHLGILRVTVEKATGINGPKKSGAKRLLQKIVKDVPDCYCKVSLGADKDVWRTSTVKNKLEPAWNETHDFLVADHEQILAVDVNDEDLGGDDDIGLATITAKQLLLSGGSQELPLLHEGAATDGKVALRAQFLKLTPDAASFSAAGDGGAGRLCGLACVLVGSALGLQGDRDKLNPSIRVTWGDKTFATAAKSYSPGVDIFNPAFDQAFTMPVTAEAATAAAPFRVALLDGKTETGGVDVPFADVLNAPGMRLEQKLDVGAGAVVRACISLRGTQLAE